MSAGRVGGRRHFSYPPGRVDGRVLSYAPLRMAPEAVRSPQTPRHLLRAYLRADAPNREKVASKVMAWVCLGTIPLALAMGPVQGWALSMAIAMCLATVSLYSLLQFEWLSRGHYHRWIPALNTLI